MKLMAHRLSPRGAPQLGLVLLFLACLPACPRESEPRAEPPASASGRPPAALASASAAPPASADPADYAWLADTKAQRPEAVDTVQARFQAPRGFRRVPLPKDSFGSWLRGLPLAAEGTPVRRFDGSVLHPGDHPNVAGVVAIDVGPQDLQQCADAIMRMHSEWKWARGDRDQSYTSASGTELPFSRFARGERVAPRGAAVSWVPGKAAARSDHGALREYLDSVFAWTNTVALARQAQAVKPDALRPGDFFVQGGNPGHAVIVVDLVVNEAGERLMLLGQSFMPAQSFHVLRPSREQTWYAVDPELAVKTPFWKPFLWDELRRLDGE